MRWFRFVSVMENEGRKIAVHGIESDFVVRSGARLNRRPGQRFCCGGVDPKAVGEPPKTLKVKTSVMLEKTGLMAIRT